MAGRITVVGLGPGGLELMTGQCRRLIQETEQLVLRTLRHPAAQELLAQGRRPDSYDGFYEQYGDFAAVYTAIVDDLLLRAQQGVDVVYAVPGSPQVAEATVVLLRQRGPAAGVPITVLPALSFFELACQRLAIDPGEGLLIQDAAELDRLPVDYWGGIIVSQVYDRRVASEAKLTLMERYPDEHPIFWLRNLGLPEEEVRQIPLFALDREPVIDHLTSIYITPLPARAAEVFTFDPLVDVMRRLRSPEGCLWDIEQSHRSLRRYIVEEVYEVLEAIDLEDTGKLCDELGDLLLQIVFHARIAEETGAFTMQEVIDGVTEKMIRRHPHVFGAISVRDAAEVVVNWEAIKQGEQGHEDRGVLDGVPKDLPALMRAFKLQAKAAKVGFDWSAWEPVWAKVEEELAELRQAIAVGEKGDIEGEYGDVLFSLVNLGRFLHIEPEVALTGTNDKFYRRFACVEAEVGRRGGNWREFSLEQLDGFWDLAKKAEKS